MAVTTTTDDPTIIHTKRDEWPKSSEREVRAIIFVFANTFVRSDAFHVQKGHVHAKNIRQRSFSKTNDRLGAASGLVARFRIVQYVSVLTALDVDMHRT